MSHGDPSGIRTRVTAVRGRRTRPLYDGAASRLTKYRMNSRAGKPICCSGYSGPVARIVIAPDSFKGALSATHVADAIAEGWLEARPDDEIVRFPMADGGEGTLDAIALATPGTIWHRHAVTGPDRRVLDAAWLMLPGDVAVLELARTSGLPQMASLDPRGATTRGLGELLAIALDHGARSVLIGLGGSGTTDAGIGALEALGALVTRPTPGHGVIGVAAIDNSALRPPPPGGVRLLVDTTVPMLEAPRIFGPQKGASPTDIAALTAAFELLREEAGSRSAHAIPGSGAAGATAWGLMTYFGALVEDGASTIAGLIGLREALMAADLVVTGEGRFDSTSLSGKVVGFIYEHARSFRVPGCLVVGSATADVEIEWPVRKLVDHATSTEEAIVHTASYVRHAARDLSQQFDG